MAIVRFGEEKKNNVANRPAPLVAADLSAWDGKGAPTRDWAVPDIMPLRNVTLLSGEGAIGKSILMMQLCCATVLARSWIGHLPEPGPALYLGAEDDEDELHRRLESMVKHYHVGYSDLVQGGLRIYSMAGQDAVLATAHRFTGVMRPTPLYEAMMAEVVAVKPKLIVLDTAADVFGGNESDRAQVRQFVGLLRALAIAGSSAVLLASHPSLAGVNTDTGLSGSTAWHNSCRARLYLKALTNGDASHEQHLRRLDMRKSNYGALAESKNLEWKDGVFVPVSTMTDKIDEAVRTRRIDEVFLTILARYVKTGRNVSDRGGPTSASKLFVDEQEAKEAGVTADQIRKAQVRLFQQEKIVMESYGRPSNPHRRMVPTVLAV